MVKHGLATFAELVAEFDNWEHVHGCTEDRT